MIVGLKFGKEVRVKKIRCKSDFKLVIGQVNGYFQAKDTQMQKYYHLMMCLLNCFVEYELKHIFRENKIELMCYQSWQVPRSLGNTKHSYKRRLLHQAWINLISLQIKLVVTLG